MPRRIRELNDEEIAFLYENLIYKTFKSVVYTFVELNKLEDLSCTVILGTDFHQSPTFALYYNYIGVPINTNFDIVKKVKLKYSRRKKTSINARKMMINGTAYSLYKLENSILSIPCSLLLKIFNGSEPVTFNNDINPYKHV